MTHNMQTANPTPSEASIVHKQPIAPKHWAPPDPRGGSSDPESDGK